MKKSKLDLHRDFVMQRLQSKTSISKIRRDLADRGCSISHSALSEWIDTTAAALGIVLPPRKRGRPVESKPALFTFLPQEGEPDPGSVTAPLFLYALQEMPSDVARAHRDHALTELGLPKGSNPVATQADDVERLANLGDTDLCLLALLRSDLPAPPFTKGHEELNRWFTELIKYACELREETRAATKRKPGETSLKESPCA